MSIIRAIVLKDSTVTALATSCGVGTAFDLGALESEQSVFAVMHKLTTQGSVTSFKVFSGSSSGFGVGSPGTCRFGFDFTGATCARSQWETPITGAFATCQRFWRFEWAWGSGGSGRLLAWMNRSC